MAATWDRHFDALRAWKMQHGGQEPPITFHQNHECYGKDVDPERCLDYVWLRGAVHVDINRGVSLVGTEPKNDDPTLYPSDHYGVLANLLVGSS